VNDDSERVEEDYYAGYYWGRNPYDSEYISTEKTDDRLKNKVLQNLQRNSIYSDVIIVSVHGGLILLEGKIRTYEERKRIGRIVWNTPGVAKVLNQLSVSDPETAGPAKITTN
jgi:osmotically-inducible protein OsmY